jgi:hypothetical protein
MNEQDWDTTISHNKDAEIERLYDTITRLITRAEAAEQTLESLTPGGSEFHGSPANCAEWIGKRMASIVQNVKARREAEARAEATEQALAAIPTDALRNVLYSAKQHAFMHGYDNHADVAEVEHWLARLGVVWEVQA